MSINPYHTILQELNDLSGHHTELMIVTKGRLKEEILPYLKEGHIDFAENKVQEAYEKWPELKALYPFMRLYLIGPLQTNKVKKALSLFDVIATIDRFDLIDKIASLRAEKAQTKEFWIQVNIGRESQKSGIMPEEADALYRYALKSGLNVVGLQAIPPQGQDPTPFFKDLKTLAHSLGGLKVSMGMSDDYRIAAGLQSNYVRIGRALFKNEAEKS